MPEQALSPRAVYSAKPTIRLEGKPSAKATELLLEMEMREDEGGMSYLQMRFSNVASKTDGGAELAFETDGTLDLGKAITVYAGDETEPREIFSGVISGLEAEFSQDSPPELIVLAEDALQRARMQRRTEFHKRLDLAKIARKVAQSAGLKPIVTGLTDNIGDQMQLNESDLAFLRRLLRKYDGDLQVVGSELHVSLRKDVSRPLVEMELFGHLNTARCIADLAHQTTSVTATGWDPVQATKFSVQSTGSHLGPGEGAPGERVLREAFGTRAEHAGHHGCLSAEEAKAMTDAIYDQRARKFVCIEGTSEGNASLRVGSRVKVSGISSRFDNTYYVTSACHRYDQTKGYETDFVAECAYLGTAG